MRAKMQGLTLVELMVAMVLGLVVIGGAVSLTMANRQSFRTNEGLSQVQESARTAFELLSRDIREAAVSGCDRQSLVVNVLDPGSGLGWWGTWFGVRGHDGDADTSAASFGTDERDRIADTDALQLQGIRGVPMSLVSHNAGSSQMVIEEPVAAIEAGDVMFVCDFDHSAIFQVTAFDGVDTITHAAGSGTPGNCTIQLGRSLDPCTSSQTWTFPQNAMLGHMLATDWYIGANGRVEDGGRSLYRQTLGPGGVVQIEEIVAGVSDMQLTYLVDEEDEFLPADNAAVDGSWDDVLAVRVELTVQSAETRVSTDLAVNQGRLDSTFSQIITLRNRVP